MKNVIRFLLIFTLVFTGSWVVFDDFIIKKLIIHNAEAVLKKDVQLKDVSVFYFPRMGLELTGLKLPNPQQNNYLMVSDQLKITINTGLLLQKKLIVNAITSQSTQFLVPSDTLIPLRGAKPSADASSASASGIQTVIRDSIKTILPGADLFNTSDMTDNLAKTVNFDDEWAALDTLVDQTGQALNQKKAEILNQSNIILYELNQIQTQSISTVSDIETVRTKLDQANERLLSVNTDVASLSTLYQSSSDQIDALNVSMDRKITAALSFDLPSLNVGSSNVANVVSNALANFVRRLVSKSPTPTVLSEDASGDNFGVTYDFSTNRFPSFLIESVTINTPESSDYLSAKNITWDADYRSRFQAQLSQKNKSMYRALSLQLTAETADKLRVDMRIDGQIIPDYKLLENDDIIFMLDRNEQTQIRVSGLVSTASDVAASVAILDPTYKLINKRPNTHFLTHVVPYLNKKPLHISATVLGPLSDMDVTVDTNVTGLIHSAKGDVIQRKQQAFNRQKNRQIRALKNQKNAILNQKKAVLSTSYQSALNTSKFHQNEIENKKNGIQDRVTAKKKALKDKAKAAVKDALKNTLPF
ncbi:MAG: hypothetical protein ACO3K7_05040 [Candidatus Marinamargulisbacteria bacterium]